jgi:hypothetical protein
MREGYVERMTETINAYEILVRKPEGKKSPWNIRIDGKKYN